MLKDLAKEMRQFKVDGGSGNGRAGEEGGFLAAPLHLTSCRHAGAGAEHETVRMGAGHETKRAGAKHVTNHIGMSGAKWAFMLASLVSFLLARLVPFLLAGLVPICFWLVTLHASQGMLVRL